MNDKRRFNPKIHHRKSIRLKDYDYAKEGLYFITMCCYDRACLFGEITETDLNTEMALNEAGKIAEECWLNIPNHFPNVILHEYVIMPNHIHGIIEITETNIRTNQHSPNNEEEETDQHSPGNEAIVRAKDFSPQQPQRPRSPSKTVGSIVRGFKIGVTKWARQHTGIYRVWQRNYYEHIIRNDDAYENISAYIINNPAKWAADKFNPRTCE